MREARFCDFLKLLPGVSERIDQVCDRFESAWRSGRRPLLECHLGDTPEPERTALARELIQVEVHYRRQAGEDPKPNDYQALFPEAMPTWIADVVAPDPDSDSVLESSVITPPPVGTNTPTAFVVDGIRVPGYEVLKEVGRGGMGIVYKARHVALNRVVALKMIRAESQADAGRLARFRAEAEAAARLQHPHIVQIHEIGEHDGHTYLALEFVDGGSLAQRIAATPPSFREAAQIVEILAEAMQHAHQRGVVHRDLKPANVLLTENGNPKIADFGLAKLSAGEVVCQTQTGDVMGTPCYMAPEQTGGIPNRVGPAADIYALGVILYELLTGRPPFRGDTPLETLAQVRDHEPTSPRTLNRRVDPDLEAVCLKCLEKKPTWRYPSAAVLADELRRYLNDEPLRHTRRVGIAERLWRWARRNPARATAACLAVAMLTGLVVGPTVLAYQQNQHNQALKKALRDTQYQLAVNHLDQGLNLCEQGNGGVGLLKLAQGLAKTPDDAHDLKYVFRTNLASWPDRLHTLKGMLDHGREIYAAAFSPDGKWTLTAGADGEARLFDLSTGHMQRAFKHPPFILAAAFSPDGKYVVTAGKDGAARIWDTNTGDAIGLPMEHGDEVHAVAFSPDGRMILTGCKDGTARLWDASTGEPGEVPPYQHKMMVNSVAFSPDGKTALSAGWDNTAQRWEVSTGKQIGKPFPHGVMVICAVFSPDGHTIATASADKSAQMWNVDTGERIGYPLQHASMVESVTFSPDGRYILTGSYDKTARLWDVKTGKLVGQSLFHPDAVRAVAFSPDGRTLLTGGDDGVARLWEAASEKARGFGWTPRGDVRAVAFSPDGKLAVAASWDGTAEVRDTADGALKAILEHNPTPNLPADKQVLCVAFSHDSKLILTGGMDQMVWVWDAAKGKRVRSLWHDGWVQAVACSPIARLAVTTCGKGTVHFWDLSTGDRIRARHGEAIHRVAVSPDGRMALTASSDRTAGLWDVATGTQLAALPHDRTVRVVAFSSDHRRVLTGGYDNSARLWDISTTPPLLVAELRHQKEITGVAFSPDGTLATTASEDNTVCLWESAGGRPRHSSPCLWHPEAVLTLAFTPDGHILVSGGRDGTVRLWDVTTGKQIGPPLPHVATVGALAVSPNGELVLAGCDRGGARLWKMPIPVEGSERQITGRIQRLIGMRFLEGGMVEALDAKAWRQCCRELEELAALR